MEIDLSGTAGFNNLVKPDEKYKRWTLDIYLDKESMAKFNEAGLQNMIRKDDQDNEYIRLARPVQKIIKDDLVKFNPPTVWYNLVKYEGKFIPTGSKITARLTVYDTVEGKASRLEKIRIDTLADYEYKPKEDIPF